MIEFTDAKRIAFNMTVNKLKVQCRVDDYELSVMELATVIMLTCNNSLTDVEEYLQLREI